MTSTYGTLPRRPARQAQLEREHGLAIVGTHFGKGFLRDGRVRHKGGAVLLKGYALFRPGGAMVLAPVSRTRQTPDLRTDTVTLPAARERAARHALPRVSEPSNATLSFTEIALAASDSCSERLDHSSGHVTGRYNATYELRFRPTQCLSP